MTDLTPLILGALIVCSGIALATRHRRLRPYNLPIAGALLVVSLVIRTLWGDSLLLARLLPTAGVVVIGQAVAMPAATWFLRCVTPRLPRSPIRRIALLTPLAAGVLWLSFGFLIGSPPPTQTMAIPDDGVLRQTSDASCSAAAAVSLLAAAGIDATEPEMASLCLTRDAGTPMLGTYRGLRKKTDRTLWRVVVLSHADVSALANASERRPILISVGLDRWQRGYDPRYVDEWGWTPGKRHAVLCYGFRAGGKVEIGDPSVGRELWDRAALDVLWNGEGIALAPR